MAKFSPEDAYGLGYRNGFDNPDDFTMGMTWKEEELNEAYDRGVNDGQKAALRQRQRHTRLEGESNA